MPPWCSSQKGSLRGPAGPGAPRRRRVRQADEFADGILPVVLIFSGVVVAARITGEPVSLYSRRVRGLPLSYLLPRVAQVAVVSTGMLVVLRTLPNLISGVLIIASGQVRPGEYIKLSSGEEGYVEDINWRNTTIRALPQNMVVVPNSTLSASTITNH